MDPITIGLEVVGMGMQIFGGMSAANDAKHAAEVQKQMAQTEQQINNQKQQQMELEGRRQQLQIFRNAQRARAQATAAAVSQGAQLGSGLFGGYGQISGDSNESALGISQNLEIGRNVNALNTTLSGQKQQLADTQSSMATDQAWASLGGSITKNAGTIGGLAKDAGSAMKFNAGGFFFQ